MKKFVKIFATVIVFLIIGLFVFRCCMVADHSYGRTPYPTDALKAAFSDGDSEIKKPEASAEISEGGLFSAYNMFYNPESGEVQVTVRWNNSTYEKTGDAEGDDYDFVLVNRTTGEEYPCTAFESKHRSIYNYRRLTAKAVISDGDGIVIEMVKSGDAQLLKHAEQPLREYKIRASVLRSLTD